ncbi:hypothetical protein [Naasia sp. SYSU D00948]|uniref:hypothetical protein n=1 Tax=Naasia sp. SYSU D00948 TaxID=2817379 RepID=UPI001B3056B3|nr:hypothetical protein [Naasia sp. SYSU D00948]
MPLWGIVLLGLAAWMLVSVVLGLIIGRAVRVADAHRRDQEFVRRLSRPSEAHVQHDDAPTGLVRTAPSPSPARALAGDVLPAGPRLAHR